MRDKIAIILILLQMVTLGVVMKGYAIFLPFGMNSFRILEIKAAALAIFFVSNIALFYIIAKQKRWEILELFLFVVFVMNSLLAVTIFTNASVWLPRALKYVIFVMLIFALLITGVGVKKNRSKKKRTEVKKSAEDDVKTSKPEKSVEEISEFISKPEWAEEKETLEKGEYEKESHSEKGLEKIEKYKVKKEKDFVASKSGKVFHKKDCMLAKRIRSEAKVFFGSAEEASDAGYDTCKRCMA